MFPVTTSINRLQALYEQDPELIRTVLNASSPVEVNLALDILRETTPERALVAAVNLREVLLAIPTFPCSMAVDEATLARVSGLEKDRLAWYKPLETGLGLTLTTAGNFCFDLIVQAGDEAVFVTPVPPGGDIVNPRFVDLLIERDGLLGQIIDIVIDMGLVFSPQPYLSLEDWSLDHAQQIMDDIGELF